MPHQRPAGWWSTLALIAVLALACGDRGPGGGNSVDSAAEPGSRSYSVRGLVRRLPETGGDLRRELWIHHEAIPEFVGIDGRVVGMDAMTMPFTIAEGVDLGGLEPGDKIAFRLEVDWEGSPPSQIVEIHELDGATRLEFE